ncbi:MAG: ABC transporter [Proteobacteria bacterium]|nr:MAG: ABC transporter [Pseudomonadota bacterium]
MSDNVLSLTDVHKAFGPKVILDGVSFGLDAGETIGLIGDNGTGKSTFLKILSGEDVADAGVVARRSGLKVELLEQVPHLEPGRTAREVLSEVFAPLAEAITRYEEAAAALDPDASRWLDEIERRGGWDWHHRVERAATEAGVEDLDVEVDVLSGGQHKRVALARLILAEPELALFDEPTNHLDAATVEWLEGWIARSRAACVVVTHDRWFLDNVVTRMAELRGGRLSVYEGCYRDYLEARAEEQALRRRTGQRRLKQLKAELAWARRSPKARTSKSKARLGRVASLGDEVKALEREAARADFELDSGPRLGKTILELVRITKGFGEGPPLIDGLSFIMRKGQRYGILGPNGIGKTTLMRLVEGEIEADGGTIVRGANTKIAYFDQHRSALDPAKSVKRILCPDGGDKVWVSGRQIHVVSWVERFGLTSGHLEMRVGSLSGGERNRVALARFLLADANLLLIDEPTNDLDLPAIHALEDALLGFDGCVMVVSHDRWFLDRVATAILAFDRDPEGHPRLELIEGDYTTYRRLRKQKQDAEREVAARAAREAKRAAKEAEAARAARRAPTGPRKLTWAEVRELDGLEPQIEALEEEVAALEGRLADPGIWAAGGDEGVRTQRALDASKARLDAAYARWEALSVIAESG